MDLEICVHSNERQTVQLIERTGIRNDDVTSNGETFAIETPSSVVSEPWTAKLYRFMSRELLVNLPRIFQQNGN